LPLFFNHRLLFIHIPKCGGDTVNLKLSSLGDAPLLFVDDGSVMINRHTPQHMTYQELIKAGWSFNNNFRVASLVRHPVDRVLSEFRYLHLKRPDLVSQFAPNPSAFLDNFLSNTPEICARFDNHNLGLLEFLADQDGCVDERIYIRPTLEMPQWLSDLGLPAISDSERRNVTTHLIELPDFNQSDIQRIEAYYAQDISWFEMKFPKYAKR
jgi:hypothetical protein